MKTTNKHKTAIVLLNWNGAQDTIDCLNSLYLIKNQSFITIVCDNNSSDGSIEKFIDWANITPFLTADNKKTAYKLYTRKQAEVGGCLNNESRLILIQTGDNLGFAGGNNVALRYCLARNEFEYVWILNNDTIVNENTLNALIEKMVLRPDIGICGSKLIFYHHPDKVQAWGGSNFNHQYGFPIPIGHFADVSQAASEQEVESKMEYVIGASMMVSMDFLQDVGLMTEDYFLYYEEIDWAFRAKEKFKLGYCDKSIVYHKEGGSIGSSSSKEPSALSTYYLYKNRLKFNWRFNRKYFLFCLLRVAYEMLVYLKRGHLKTLRAMLRGIAAFFLAQDLKP